MTQLNRTIFDTSRLLDFFTVQDLVAQTGHQPEWWAEMAVKELSDNSLDACETDGLAPTIRIVITDRTITVSDNGPGIPLDTLRRMIDFSSRTSDKAKYVAPTRGSQGNALKTLLAVPYVLSGQTGQVDVTTQGETYRITVRANAIKQEPVITLEQIGSEREKIGTSVTIHWPELASV